MSKTIMTMIHPPAAQPRLAPLAARALAAASRLLDRLAARLDAASAARPAIVELVPLLEFHAEAGAPEGALYFDGELIGTLPGVTRL